MLILVFDINAQTTYFHSWIIASKVGQQIDIIFKQIGHSQQTPTIVFCVVE